MEDPGASPAPDPAPPPSVGDTRAGARPPDRPGFGPGRAFLVFLAYLGAQIVAGLVIGIVIGIRSAATKEPLQELIDGSMPGMLLLGMSFGGGAALLVTRAFCGPLRSGGRFGLLPATPRQVLAGVGAGLLLGLVLHVVTALTPPKDADTVLSQVASTDAGYWIVLFIALVLAPPIEEFVFRGVIYDGLRTRLSAATSTVLVTLAFTALHATELAHYTPGFALIAALSLVTLLLRTTTGSLFPAVAAHVAYNACAVLG